MTNPQKRRQLATSDAVARCAQRPVPVGEDPWMHRINILAPRTQRNGVQQNNIRLKSKELYELLSTCHEMVFSVALESPSVIACWIQLKCNLKHTRTLGWQVSRHSSGDPRGTFEIEPDKLKSRDKKRASRVALNGRQWTASRLCFSLSTGGQRTTSNTREAISQTSRGTATHRVSCYLSNHHESQHPV